MYQTYNRIVNINENVTIYIGDVGSTAVTKWFTWQKPSWAKLVSILCIGGGAGGNSGATSTQGGGGGGGGASTFVKFSAQVIPDLLYIQPGLGSIGASPSGNLANNATASYVSITNNTTAANLLCIANGGSAGASVSGAGAAGTVITQSNALLIGLGMFNALAGVAGGGGGISGSAGSNVAPLASTNTPFCCGGAGGGSSIGGAGGNITGVGFLPTITGGSADGQAGISGFDWFGNRGDFIYPMISTGGSGGSYGSISNGGKGGNGGIGSGGGGGGQASAGGGSGGNGGPGAIILTCW